MRCIPRGYQHRSLHRWVGWAWVSSYKNRLAGLLMSCFLTCEKKTKVFKHSSNRWVLLAAVVFTCCSLSFYIMQRGVYRLLHYIGYGHCRVSWFLLSMADLLVGGCNFFVPGHFHLSPESFWTSECSLTNQIPYLCLLQSTPSSVVPFQTCSTWPLTSLTPNCLIWLLARIWI